MAVNDHQFLVDERDGKSGTAAQVKQFFLIDLNGATDVTGNAALPSGFKPVNKGATPFIDMLNPAFGLNNASFPQKIEGLAFGNDITVNGVSLHTLWVTNDNDFEPGAPNNFYVFGISSTDLPTYQAQEIAPEPQTFALLAAGVGVVAWRIRRTRT